ncbi:glycine-rich protein 3-like [Daphnia pulicaria]|uniref:glycine-rich protein 3-like n=1 Tax=Daphnia pulicaria TaxID=35523 RepID=UPI001EEBA2D3|nr:glycine-rich protein 3-like [Daphnia pulicaria]
MNRTALLSLCVLLAVVAAFVVEAAPQRGRPQLGGIFGGGYGQQYGGYGNQGYGGYGNQGYYNQGYGGGYGGGYSGEYSGESRERY